MVETRKSYEELKAIFAKAGDGIVVGGVYAHYKHPELPAHKVVSVALREEEFFGRGGSRGEKGEEI